MLRTALALCDIVQIEDDELQLQLEVCEFGESSLIANAFQVCQVLPNKFQAS